MQKNVLMTWVATIGFAGVLFVNALAIFQPLNGLTTKQVSDLYPNLFTPAGITFSIWTVIYLLLIGFLVLGWQRKERLIIEKILPWFIVTCVLNMSWILAWHFLLPFVSVLIMFGLLVVLSRIFLLIHRSTASDGFEKTFVFLPFTVYLAWICVATIANFTALLVHWNLVGEQTTQENWTIVMMTLASLLSILFQLRFRAWAFAVVVLWALFGICLRWKFGEHPFIVFAAIVLMVGVITVLFYGLLKSRQTDR